MFHIEGFRYGTMRTVITPESPSSQAPAGPDPADRLRPDDRAGAFGTRRGAVMPVEPGLADPAWTRLAVEIGRAHV